MNNSILVTGGAGFIGSHLIDYLLKHTDKNIIIIDNLSTGNLNNLQNNEKTIFHGLDIRYVDYASWDYILSDVSFIFHLASVVGVNNVMNDPLLTIDTNIFGSKNMIDVAVHKRIPILFTSSSEVYGKNNGESIKETDDRIVGDVKNKRWVYACTKTLEEFYLLALYEKYDLPVIITRLFNTIGPRQVGDYGMVVPRFIRAALNNESINVYGDGTQKRSFCDIRDTIYMLYSLYRNYKAYSGEIFNIGNDQEISILNLAYLVRKITDNFVNINFIPYKLAYGNGFEDMQSRRPDITKIKNAFEYIAGYPLKNSIEYIIENTL